jgi:hypothetical protein
MRTEWDLWSYLEGLEKEWTQQSSDDLPWKEVSEPSGSDVQHDGELLRLDNLTKAYVKLLGLHRPEKINVDNDSPVEPQSSRPIDERKSQEPPFDLWDTDGTPLGTSIFMKKSKTVRGSSTGKRDQISSTGEKDLASSISKKDPASSTDHQNTCLINGTCQRCEMTSLDRLSRKGQLKHAAHCRGKCERCRNLSLPCDHNTLRGRNVSCTNCKSAETRCSGPVTHVHLDTVGTCERCGTPNIRHLRDHQRKCRGKCQECSERNIPCDIMSKRGKPRSCTNCEENHLECGGAVTHAHLCPDTVGTCQRCEMPQVANVAIHQQTCRGKCEGCKQRNIPCDFSMHGGSHPRCTSCNEQQMKCSGPITHTHLTENTKGTCPRCGVIRKGSANLFHQHQNKCQGKCERCKGQDIPCSFVGSSRSCANCMQEQLQCSGRVTHVHLVQKENNERTCHWCATIPDCNPNSFYRHQKECKGKCKECQERDIPCQFSTKTSKGCEYCAQEKLQCSGRVTRAELKLS